MAKIIKKMFMPVFLALFITGGAFVSTAQNMSHTVVRKQIKFARGQNEAVLRGAAKYEMSYVYALRARKGQTMEIALSGNNPELTFSLILPDEETDETGFGVTEWTGELPQSGEYKIVVVMNDQNSKAVPYKLDVRIN